MLATVLLVAYFSNAVFALLFLILENQPPVLKTPLKHVAVLYDQVTIPLQAGDPEGTPVAIMCKSCPTGAQVTKEKKLKYRVMTEGVKRFALVLKDKGGSSTAAVLVLDVCACRNGGRCILKGPDSYTCSCHRCYTGKHCETELTARDDPECDPSELYASMSLIVFVLTKQIQKCNLQFSI